MTLHDKLKQILVTYEQRKDRYLMKADLPDPTPSTISAIIAAVVERLPGVAAKPPVERPEIKWITQGWNAYRQEVLKVLEEKL